LEIVFQNQKALMQILLKKIISFSFMLLLVVVFFVAPAFSVVRISNMNDFSFGSWTGVGDLVQSDSICIHDSSTANTNRYTIRATGSGGGGAFSLNSGPNTLAYAVAWQGSQGGIVNLTSGTNTNFRRASTSTTCGGGTNATLRITITEANMLAATAGSYSGTLTILLQP
jgi:hypothetical protein